MPKINIVISASQQSHNKCALGDSEQSHMHMIGKEVRDILSADNRLNVYLVPKLNNDDKSNLYEAIRLSNQFIVSFGGQGYHLALHSDGGYKGSGASGFYASEYGRTFGLPIFKEMSQLTPWPDMNFYERKELAELKRTIATSFLLEVSFHDKKNEAEWIHSNIKQIATSIVKGIYKGINLEPLEDFQFNEAIKTLQAENLIKSPDHWINHDDIYVKRLLSLFATYINKHKE